MPRTMLTDEQWTKLNIIWLESGRVCHKEEHRITIEGILYRMRAATNQSEAIGKSRGGNTTKISMAVDSQGLPMHFKRSSGKVHDSQMAEMLMDELPEANYILLIKDMIVQRSEKKAGKKVTSQ